MAKSPCTCLAPGIEVCEACEPELTCEIEKVAEVLDGTVVDSPPRNMYPSQIGVWCDRCRIIHMADYMVAEDDDQKTRHGYARTHLNTLGWRCNENGDYCPDCKDKVDG